MKRQLPFLLTTLRLLLGPVALLCAFAHTARWVYFPILVIATLSDIYDGVLARKFGVATTALRRYDSSTDVIFYLFILGVAWKLCRPVLSQSWWAIALVILSEIALIAICFIRFGKYPAAHSYLAKFFGLCLLACLIALLVFDAGNWAVYTLAIVGVTTNIEIIVMHLIATRAPVDVKSIFTLKKTEG